MTFSKDKPIKITKNKPVVKDTCETFSSRDLLEVITYPDYD